MFERDTAYRALAMLRGYGITVLSWQRTPQGATAICECGGLIEHCELTPKGVRAYLGY